VGVSYFTGDEVDHVYQSEWATETYDREQVDKIVRDLQLESLGYGAYEQRQQSQLHATVRIYDELLDITVPVNEFEGVAVALDTSGDYEVRNVVEQIEDVVSESHIVEREPVYQY
jgi:hypothetical protein